MRDKTAGPSDIPGRQRDRALRRVSVEIGHHQGTPK